MNLAQLKENSRAEHYAVQAFLSVLQGDPVELITTAMQFVASSKYFANTPPPGDADDIDGLADGYGESATKVQDLIDQIATIATQGLPDAMAGKAGTTVIEAVESFRFVLESDMEGLKTARNGLRKYASDLREAVRLHAIGLERAQPDQVSAPRPRCPADPVGEGRRDSSVDRATAPGHGADQRGCGAVPHGLLAVVG